MDVKISILALVSMAAVINEHKFGGLKYHKLVDSLTVLEARN